MTRATSSFPRFLTAALWTLAALSAPSSPAEGQLGPTGTQFWNQGSPGLGTTLESDAETGRALAIGDFDCDGFGDLAIGMPGDEAGGDSEAGRVLVLYGSHGGPVTEAHSLLSQDTPGIQDATGAMDHFGESLAAGDFDGDACDDLAIGAPGESLEGEGVIVEAGGVHVLYGSVLGLTVDGNDFFTQATADMPGVAQADDRFGSVLFAADFDFDADDELIIGVPGEDLEGETPVTDAGAVHLLAGGPGGLSAGFGLLFVSGDEVVNWIPGDFDRLGSSFAAYRLGNPPSVRLAIGAPGRDVQDEDAAGEVVSLFGPMTALPQASYMNQNGDIPGAPESFDHFGAALAAGDFDGDGHDELVVGVPGEDLEVEQVESAGAVIVVDVWNDIDHTLILQDYLTPEASEDFDRFGASLATGDWNGDGRKDLAIGVPGETLGGLEESGVVHILFAGQNGIEATNRQLWLQTIDPSEDGDQFGATLAAGRLSGHTGEDLAIGVPGENLGAAVDAGGVNVLFSIVLFIDGFEDGLSPWSDVQP